MISKLRLKISGKSTITGSDPAMVQEVQRDLAKSGIHLQIEESAKDLGVDYAGGGRRRIPVQQRRMLNVKRAATQVSVLGKETKQARRLVITGVRSRFYGFAAMGASPTTCKQMRAKLCNAAGIRKAGGCATTAMALAGIEDSDPMVAYPLETVLEFGIAHIRSGMKLVNAEAWRRKRADLQAGGRWAAKVCGSLSAAIASLEDAGFEAPEVDRWTDPAGKVWMINFDKHQPSDRSWNTS